MSVPSAPDSTIGLNSDHGFRIGVFDSGVGGLSVLRAIRAHLPAADLVYVADSGFAPYGERDQAFIEKRCHLISDFLKSQAVDAIVVACNTATAIAVHSLRQRLHALPIIGVEPGVKPAIAQSANKRVGVLATPRTLSSDKFRKLVETHGQNAQLYLQPCPGLAREIEVGHLGSAALLALIQQFCEPLKQAGVDTVVLGCTHYPFAQDTFREVLGPNVTLLDTAEAVARRTAALLGAASPATSGRDGTVQLWSSGDPAHLQKLAMNWLGWHLPVQALPAV